MSLFLSMKDMTKPHFSPIIIIVCFAVVAGATVQANDIEGKFIKAGLIDVQAVDKTIRVDLVNSDPHKNYFRKDFYHGLSKAYLQSEVAGKLSQAQKYLESKHSGYSLLIMDAARPRSVSRQMYDTMKGTRFEKFVADPKTGSMHNYGIAVDVTIVDEKNQKLDMGFIPFYKSDLSIYWGYAKKKIFGLNETQKKNRKLLSEIMQKAGFIPLSYEWWHFNGMPKDKARQEYTIIE